MGDGEFNCQNRADKEAFEIGIGNSSSPMIALKQVLKVKGNSVSNVVQ